MSASVVTWPDHATIYGGPVKGSARSIGFLTFLEAELAREKPECRLSIIQSAYNAGVPASAGTHDGDAVYDVQIVGLDWLDAQRWLRRKGFLCWYRYPTKDWGSHIHGIVGGCDMADVGYLIPDQVSDYYNHLSGMVGHAPDNTWHPDPQFIFDYPQWLRSLDVQLDDKIGDGETTVSQVLKRMNRLTEIEFPAFRESFQTFRANVSTNVADLEHAIDDIPPGASIEDVKASLREQTRKIRKAIDEATAPPEA